jgi:hypothetical protein
MVLSGSDPVQAVLLGALLILIALLVLELRKAVQKRGIFGGDGLGERGSYCRGAGRSVGLRRP